MSDAAMGEAPMDEAVELRRLRWRCRRGMRELDQLMLRYLEQRWPDADASERATFDALLATEDDLLWRWCMGREAVADPVLAGFLQRLLALPA